MPAHLVICLFVPGCKVLSAHWHKVVWDAGTLIQQIIQDFTDHSSSDCRQQYFEILRSAWQLRPAMHAVLRPALLVMLGDPDSQLRAEALSFWDSALPKAVGPRLQALLQDSLAEPAHLVSPPLHLPLPSCSLCSINVFVRFLIFNKSCTVNSNLKYCSCRGRDWRLSGLKALQHCCWSCRRASALTPLQPLTGAHTHLWPTTQLHAT